MNKALLNWWKWLKYEPNDPRFNVGGVVKIAVIGGGSGLSTLLRGLKKYSNNISAIVAVTDDGSSSGEIREEFDILPPGDIRKCISALAYDEKLISKIFEHRFKEDKKNFGGHTLGNIWITALTDYFGSFERAIEATTEIFQSAGKVLPATLDHIKLGAEFEDGERVIGETKLVGIRKKIHKVFLNKKNVRSYRPATEAIESADIIILGPGSLYTSLAPNLLIAGIKNAIRANSKALKIYIANCSTERGETENYSVGDHIKALLDHSSKGLFDYCLVNTKVLRKSIYSSKLGEVNNITTAEKFIHNVAIVRDNVVDSKNPLYHDPEKLAKVIIELYNNTKRK